MDHLRHKDESYHLKEKSNLVSGLGEGSKAVSLERIFVRSFKKRYKTQVNLVSSSYYLQDILHYIHIMRRSRERTGI